MKYGLWNEALEKAKEEFDANYRYLEEDEWDELIKRAKEIMRDMAKECGFNNNSEVCKDDHRAWLQTDQWKKLREYQLKRDNYICRDCGEKATQVHHTNYNNIGNPWEIYSLVSLCEMCHKKRHKIPIPPNTKELGILGGVL